MSVITTWHSKQLGNQAEALACDYLTKQGLRLVLRNYLCKLGEIDLIMRDRNYLVFVEVRYRKQTAYGNPFESVNYFKQRKLIKTARYYLQTQQLYNTQACRFDVIAVDINQRIEWVKNAFTA